MAAAAAALMGRRRAKHRWGETAWTKRRRHHQYFRLLGPGLLRREEAHLRFRGRLRRCINTTEHVWATEKLLLYYSVVLARFYSRACWTSVGYTAVNCASGGIFCLCVGRVRPRRLQLLFLLWMSFKVRIFWLLPRFGGCGAGARRSVVVLLASCDIPGGLLSASFCCKHCVVLSGIFFFRPRQSKLTLLLLLCP